MNVARREAARRPGAVFADQFENLANMRAHMHTGREVLEQTDGSLDAFVSGAGVVCHGYCVADVVWCLSDIEGHSNGVRAVQENLHSD